MNYELKIKDKSNVDSFEDDGIDYNNISDLEDELHRLIHWANQYGSSGADGKIEKDQNGKIINTGNTIEYTEYVFRDLMGETIKIMSANNKFREFENKSGNLVLNIERKEFGGKTENRIALKDFLPAGK